MKNIEFLIEKIISFLLPEIKNIFDAKVVEKEQNSIFFGTKKYEELFIDLFKRNAKEIEKNIGIKYELNEDEIKSNFKRMINFRIKDEGCKILLDENVLDNISKILENDNSITVSIIKSDSSSIIIGNSDDRLQHIRNLVTHSFKMLCSEIFRLFPENEIRISQDEEKQILNSFDEKISFIEKDIIEVKSRLNGIEKVTSDTNSKTTNIEIKVAELCEKYKDYNTSNQINQKKFPSESGNFILNQFLEEIISDRFCEEEPWKQISSNMEINSIVFWKCFNKISNNIDFLSFFISGLLICLAIDTERKDEETLLRKFLNTRRTKDIIQFENLFFYKNKKIKSKYKGLEKLSFFNDLTKGEISNQLKDLVELRNSNFNFKNHKIREIVNKLSMVIKRLKSIFSKINIKSMAIDRANIEFEGRNLCLNELFILKGNVKPINLKVFKGQIENQTIFSDGLNEELISPHNIKKYIDKIVQINIEEINYIGELIKVNLNLFKNSDKEKYKFIVDLSIDGEIFDEKIVWEDENKVFFSSNELEEGIYKVSVSLIEANALEKYKKGSKEHKRELELAYSEKFFVLVNKIEGKIKIEGIYPEEIFENQYGEYKIRLKNTGNTKIEAKIIFEEYGKAHLSFKPEEVIIGPYEVKITEIKLKAERAEGKKCVSGKIVVLNNGKKECEKELTEIKIVKNFNPLKFIDRKEYIKKFKKELDAEIIKKGIHVKWICGEAGQGKTRLLKELEKIGKEKGCETLTVEIDKEESNKNFLKRLAEEMEIKLGESTSYITSLKEGINKGESRLNNAADLVRTSICKFANEFSEPKIFIQIDDIHSLIESLAFKGSEFISILIDKLNKKNKNEKSEKDIRIFMYTRKTKGLGYIKPDDLKPFEKIEDRIELVELKEGVEKEEEYENVNELVWEILNEIFSPNGFDKVEKNLKPLLVKKSEGNPLILQLLLERYFDKEVIAWNGEKWELKVEIDKLSELLPCPYELKERLIVDKLVTDNIEQQKIIHLIGMLGEINDNDIEVFKVSKEDVMKLENRLLKRTENGYKFTHSLYEEYWKKEIGEKALKEKEEIEKIEELVKKYWEKGVKKRVLKENIKKFWEYLSFSEIKENNEEVANEGVDNIVIMKMLYKEDYSEKKLKMINESRKVINIIKELGKNGLQNKENKSIVYYYRHGYWLLKVLENNKNNNIKSKIIYRLLEELGKIDDENDILFNKQFAEFAQYIVDNYLNDSKKNSLELKKFIPKALYKIAILMHNTKIYDKAEEYFELSIKKFKIVIKNDDRNEDFIYSMGMCLLRFADYYSKIGNSEYPKVESLERAKEKYEEALFLFDRVIELNKENEDANKKRKNCMQSLESLRLKMGETELIKKEFKFNYPISDKMEKTRFIEEKNYESLYFYEKSVESYKNFVVHVDKEIPLSEKVDFHLERGKTKFAEGKYNDIFLSYKNFVAHVDKEVLLSEKVDYHLEKGKTEFAEGKYNDALLSFDKAIKLSDKSEKAYNYKGDCLQKLADFHLKSGEIKSAEGKYNDALLSYDKAIELNENYHEVYINKGNCLQKLADLYLNTGRVELAGKEYDNALLCYRKVINLNENNYKVYYCKGNCLQRLAGFYINIGKIESAEKKYKEAFLSYKKVIELYGNYSKAYNSSGVCLQNLANLYLEMGKTELSERKYNDSFSFFEKAIKLSRGRKSSYIYYKGLTHLKYSKLLFLKENINVGENQIDECIKLFFVFGNLNRNTDYEKSISIYKDIIDIIRESYEKRKFIMPHRCFDLVLCYKELGILYIDLNRDKKDTEKYLNEALNIINFVHDNSKIRENKNTNFEKEKFEIEEVLKKLKKPEKTSLSNRSFKKYIDQK